MKECQKCKSVKQWGMFPRSKSTSTGYDYKCKGCHRDSWHARKPVGIDVFQYPIGWVLDVQSIRQILSYDEAECVFKWSVNSAKARIGDVAGSKESNRPSRVHINGKRYAVNDLKSFWFTGEMPEKQIKEPRNLAYEVEWMKEIRSRNAFPDWSGIWTAEKARRNARSFYKRRSALIGVDEMKAEWRDKAAKRCPIKKAVSNKRWKTANTEKVKDQQDRWTKDNLLKVREYARRQRVKPENRPKLNMRNRFKGLMRTVKRGGSLSFSKTIGCTTAQLATHLQSQFKRGMTWANYGKHWHVDHILPCASFDHSVPSHVKQCWHYSNLQPLEARKNLAKSDSITHPQMSLCL